MLHKKFKPPCYQSAFNNLFNIGRDNWKDIYERKVKNMYDKRLSEFNYKLLNNILNCNSFQYKCKSRSNANCELCPCEKKDIKHLLFDCLSVQRLWQKLNSILNFDVCWKHIIIGFYLEKNSKTVFLNTIISYVSYVIYKYKMTCRMNENFQSCNTLLKFFKRSLSLKKWT